MKKTLLALTLLLLSSALYAGEKKVLSVFMTDGTNVSFYLKEQPLVTFVGDDVKIVSTTEEAVIARAQVDRFEFLTDMPAGIEEIEADDDETSRGNIEILKEAIYISGMTPNSRALLFSLKGQMLASATADGEGNASLSLESLPAGIYLINYNKTTIKFIKR